MQRVKNGACRRRGESGEVLTSVVLHVVRVGCALRSLVLRLMCFTCVRMACVCLSLWTAPCGSRQNTTRQHVPGNTVTVECCDLNTQRHSTPFYKKDASRAERELGFSVFFNCFNVFVFFFSFFLYVFRLFLFYFSCFCFFLMFCFSSF